MMDGLSAGRSPPRRKRKRKRKETYILMWAYCDQGSVSEITYYVSSGTLNLAQLNQTPHAE